MVMLKERKIQEWSKQYTHGNPFRRGQRGDQIYGGRMMLKNIQRVKSSRLEDPCPGERKMEGSGWEGQKCARRDVERYSEEELKNKQSKCVTTCCTDEVEGYRPTA